MVTTYPTRYAPSHQGEKMIPRLNFLHDWILVQRLSMPEKTTGGIILPTKAVELPQLARVIKVGPKKNHENIQPGNLVLLPKFAGLLFPIANQDYYLFHNREILAVIHES